MSLLTALHVSRLKNQSYLEKYVLRSITCSNVTIRHFVKILPARAKQRAYLLSTHRFGGLDLDQLHATELEEALDEVPHYGGTESRCERADALELFLTTFFVVVIEREMVCCGRSETYTHDFVPDLRPRARLRAVS